MDTRTRLLSKRETAAILGIHPESLMRLCREGRFPRPVKLTDADNSPARFLLEDVDAWIEGRKSHRDTVRA